jgi:hypothetical protein
MIDNLNLNVSFPDKQVFFKDHSYYIIDEMSVQKEPSIPLCDLQRLKNYVSNSTDERIKKTFDHLWNIKVNEVRDYEYQVSQWALIERLKEENEQLRNKNI